jgi:UDP-3-O-[3-hydroxymyristoyl] N-acetylglucosamine deacetylase
MRMLDVALQKTLKTPIHCTGVGLHSGVKAAVTLRPAPVDTGILFRRLDAEGRSVELPAHWSSVVESPLCTPLTSADGSTTILTIEHLMAALAGCAIDNCVVEITGPEVPVMDGSSAPFVFLIECAGIVEQRAARNAIKVLKRVRVSAGGSSVELVPDDHFSVGFEIDFESKAIGRQSVEFSIDPETFKRDLSRARTFGFLQDVNQLRAAGRGLGGSLENVIVIDGDRVLNEGGLRYPDEFVRHKALDAIGDLYLAGAPILGRFNGVRSSHALTRRLLAALFADASNWAWTHVAEGNGKDWAEPARALSA